MDQKIKILVVEDERSLQDAIKVKLTNNNFDVVTARSVEEGITALSSDPSIAVVWLDHYLLGNGSGLDFVVKMKENASWRGIPIFVVSNTAGPDKVQSYIKLGVAEYFTKSESRLDQIVDDIKQSLSHTSGN
jgi:DNA-binding NtrC family response regulator